MRTSQLLGPLLVMLLVLPTALLFSTAQPVQADCLATIYVNAAAPDDNWDGSSPVYAGGVHGPKKTIQAGVNFVCDSGTVNVAAGTYIENILITHPFTLAGAGAAATIIDGSSAVSPTVLILLAVPGTVHVSGFSIRNGSNGVWIEGYSAVLDDCIVSGSSGTTNTSGIFAIQCTLTVNRCTVSGNQGLGVACAESTIVMNSCTVKDNGSSSAPDFTGGILAGIVAQGGTQSGGQGISNLPQRIELNVTPHITRSRMGAGAGDGPLVNSITLNDCTISDNGWPTKVLAGGIAFSVGTLTVNRCLICCNVGQVLGGGLFISSSTASLTSSTISGNRVIDQSGAGAGLLAFTSEVNLLNVTIAGNTASGLNSLGGGFANFSSLTCYFKNCIVANNTAGDHATNNGYDDSNGGGVHSQGHNIDSENSCFFNQLSDQLNTNPLLGPLQDNGGPSLTQAITIDSPAFNHGDNSGAPATDQRGISRPQGAFCDVGAYELVLNKSATTGSVNGAGDVTFTTGAGGIYGLTPLQPNSCSANLPGVAFPYGIFSFRIVGIAPGATVQVTVTVPTPLPGNASYWKCDGTGGWTDVTSIVTVIPGENRLILNLTDGGLGDSDHVANGRISDPGGPAFSIGGQPQSSSAYIAPQQNAVALANIVVQSARLSSAKAEPGAQVTVTAMVSNKGTSNGTGLIKIYIDGREEASQGVTLAGSSVKPVTFTVSRSQPGTYTVFVGGENAGSFTVSEFADPNIILLISSALLLFAFVLGIIYIWRRQQGY